MLRAPILLLAATALAQMAPPQITTKTLPPGTLRQLYYQRLEAREGVPPLRWRVARGDIPPGITLDVTGVLSGMPTAAGAFRFTVELSDSSSPPRTASRNFELVIASPLLIRWTHAPQVANGGIEGEVEVANGTRASLDLTVIVVAVNEFNKAFALGYRHFSLGATAQRIPFGSSLPRGTYVVHADAIGEDGRTLSIYRARLQTPPMTVP